MQLSFHRYNMNFYSHPVIYHITDENSNHGIHSAKKPSHSNSFKQFWVQFFLLSSILSWIVNLRVSRLTLIMIKQLNITETIPMFRSCKACGNEGNKLPMVASLIVKYVTNASPRLYRHMLHAYSQNYYFSD